MRYSLTFLSLILLFLSANGQIDRDKILTFLNQPSSARVAAHGGFAMADASSDVSAFFFNPALFRADSTLMLSLSNEFLFLNSNAGNISFGTRLTQANLNVFGGFTYFTGGEMSGYDENGEPTGSFQASDVCIAIGANRPLYENLTVGATIKFALSSYESYSANALMVDLAAAYQKPGSNAVVGLAIRNAGSELQTYQGIREPLPFSIEAMGSVRLKHLPLRIGLVAHHLQLWELRYANPYDIKLTQSFEDPFAEPEINSYGFIDNLFRHLIIQTELSIGRKEGLKIRLGYNHFRKRELSVNNLRSLAGFSGGIGLGISKFRLDYGLAFYHLAGKTHTLTLSTDLNSFFRKGL